MLNQRRAVRRSADERGSQAGKGGQARRAAIRVCEGDETTSFSMRRTELEVVLQAKQTALLVCCRLGHYEAHAEVQSILTTSAQRQIDGQAALSSGSLGRCRQD